ncbi:MBL fold metallo-hydrolase [Brasilonema octagenarum UFV-E1]|uniref:MBL fold metallo-hydrolase n=2 Tax=Brasilonema TaxID=383614 RepID=A0A856MNE5_9CYAN|nr:MULTISPECIES: MBL fold metallo-hydrolase [Brasilonema]NMF63125.1 MBL fold metallo-hydrolase [Brasilonema octagenarum UFV-OR1]QDL10456.1 MBL fold metallo-hydrolase [Brasilonema sennae CENA114]QDL16802.1 MBL fold metallo-hydrolase [Brasilonema octagenarum UFV-E1]
MFFRPILAIITAVLIITTSYFFSGIAIGKTAKTQVPGVYSFMLGDFTITALSDGTLPQDLPKLLTNTNPAEIDRLLHSSFLTNPVEASINAFLIDTGDKQVLVDTGSGELFGPKLGGKLQVSLKAAGYAPDEIDTVLLTHIHSDHSGGLVKGDQLMFPTATVYVGKPDVDFWLNPANAERSQLDRKYFDEAVKTVKPYLDAGKLKPFSGKTVILPGITARPTPGHTPGHSFFLVQSGGESIEFWGDILHVASVQFPKPEITIVYDVDPNAAAVQRAKQFADAQISRRLVAGAHLPFPGVGHIRAEGKGYAWVPVDYRWREQ